MKHSAVRAMLLVLIAVGGLTAGGPSMAAAIFSDSQSVEGTISVGDFESPPESTSYIDHGNGTFTPVDATNLSGFHDESVHLVIPEEVTVPEGDNGIPIIAGSITADAEFEPATREIELRATDGEVDVSGSSIDGAGGGGGITIEATEGVNLTRADLVTNTDDIDIDAEGTLLLDDATVEATGGGGGIDLTGKYVSAHNTTLTSQNNNIILEATANGGGELDGVGMDIHISGGNNDIDLESNGDMHLTDSTLNPGNGALSAQLGPGESTLSVQGIAIDNGPLVYSGGNVSVLPESMEDDGEIE